MSQNLTFFVKIYFSLSCIVSKYKSMKILTTSVFILAIAAVWRAVASLVCINTCAVITSVFWALLLLKKIVNFWKIYKDSASGEQIFFAIPWAYPENFLGVFF